MEIKEAFKSAVQAERIRNRIRDPRSGTYGRSHWYSPPVVARHVRENPVPTLLSALALGLLVASAYGGWVYAQNRRQRRRDFLHWLYLR